MSVPSFPAGARAYQRTASFGVDDTPEALRKAHTTKPGVWGRIVVESGALELRVDGRGSQTLEPGTDGVIEPEVPHEVTPLDGARFYVEFLRVEGPA
jgi:tellurite resistance-related uncharacterized protein